MRIKILWQIILSGDFLKLYIAKLEFTIICVNIKIKERKRGDSRMGIYLNPPADGFEDILKDEVVILENDEEVFSSFEYNNLKIFFIHF